MKLVSKISVGAMVSSVILFTGCKKFLDKNDNPNNLTQSRADYIMSGALGNTARLQVGSSHIVTGTWSGMYAHSTSYTGGGNEKTYSVTNTDFDFWTSEYDNIYDYQRVIESADKDGFGFWKDPAIVMQCLVFARLVDTYGDIPFTEALRYIAESIDAKVEYQKFAVVIKSKSGGAGVVSDAKNSGATSPQ